MKKHTFKKVTGQNVLSTTDDYDFNKAVTDICKPLDIIKKLDQSGIIETENFDFHLIYSRNQNKINLPGILCTVNLISYNKHTDEAIIQSTIHCETQKIAKKYIRSIKHIDKLKTKLEKSFLVPKIQTQLLLTATPKKIEPKKQITKKSDKKISAKISTKKVETKKQNAKK